MPVRMGPARARPRGQGLPRLGDCACFGVRQQQPRLEVLQAGARAPGGFETGHRSALSGGRGAAARVFRTVRSRDGARPSPVHQGSWRAALATRWKQAGRAALAPGLMTATRMPKGCSSRRSASDSRFSAALLAL